jgi:hypothetical protein
MDESFDHIIRNEAELEQKIEYVKQNPVKHGLATQASEYKWLLGVPPSSRKHRLKPVPLRKKIEKKDGAP